ncbi:MAG: transposase [Candidatus Methanomethyliaceae archaeon]
MQCLFSLSDHQLEESCCYDSRFRYVLSLRLDDLGFDRSLLGRLSVGDYRQPISDSYGTIVARLLAHSGFRSLRNGSSG